MSVPEPRAVQRAPAIGRYEILAVRYAILRAPKSQLYHRYEAYGERDTDIEMAYYFWVLRGGGETILVDTGFDPTVGARRELDFWTGTTASRFQFAAQVEDSEIAYLAEARRAGRVRITDGIEEIFDGITAHSVGGHSPGQQVTVVCASGRDVVLASDAVHFYEELELDRPFAVIADLARMYEAYDLVRELAASPGAVVVPGHDPQVLARFPPLEGDRDAIAVRVA
jgi:glyoxylase-like metal-dependent hydrolase (beta-lactamase superfamily II)